MCVQHTGLSPLGATGGMIGGSNLPETPEHVCPHCGKCKHCGQPNVPQFPYTVPYTWPPNGTGNYPPYTITNLSDQAVGQGGLGAIGKGGQLGAVYANSASSSSAGSWVN
jgi:hypothetical protein